MDQAAVYCTVGGLCYNLASSFLLKVPWDKVLSESLKTSAKKVWSSRNAYAIVMKEAQMAFNVFQQFRRTVNQMETFQTQNGVQICSLGAAKMFIDDYEKVLAMYNPENISAWQANVAGENLRQQLQYYTVFMHSMMSAILLDISYVTMQLQSIKMEQDPRKQKELLSNLKDRCHNPRPFKSSSTKSDDEQFYDASPF